MLKLKKYFKPFIVSLIMAMIFLFTEAMCDLKLPDYMSEIVNIGIQSNGIEQVAPEVISENGMELMKNFMTQDEKQYMEESYIKINQEDMEYIEEFPAIKNTSIYSLNDNLQESEIQKLNRIFAVSSKTMINIMTEILNQTNVDTAIQETANVDLVKIYEMLPMLSNMPEQNIINARNKALKKPLFSQMLIPIKEIINKTNGSKACRLLTIWPITYFKPLKLKTLFTVIILDSKTPLLIIVLDPSTPKIDKTKLATDINTINIIITKTGP